MTADADRYAKLYEIFDAARLLEGSAREEFFRDRCGGDEELRARAERLLSIEESMEPELEPESLSAPSESSVDTTWLPERIAGYKITRHLGGGGMGTVYEAIQSSPRRSVAIKLLHPLQTHPDLPGRLRLEAELLGRLQHPAIAQIYEAGTYDLGRGEQPFFAMELINGVDLRTYCTRENIDLRGRLALLARICDAVDYAHGKGVIHRDLKPDNILVNEHGQPKVLDFGIARTTDDSSLVSTQMTQDGQILGTLAYIAPEQLAADSSLVTERTDVYGLGVIGYELVADRLPFVVSGLGLASAIRLLQEEDAAQLGSLNHRWRGDIEVIIGHALEKEPSDRYPSAGALAADLRRHLDHEPVQAHAPSGIYRLRKRIRKNRGTFAAIVVVFLSLSIGLGWALVERSRADRRAAEQAAQSYRANLSVAADAVAEGRMTTGRQFLEAAPEELRGWEWNHLSARLDPSIRHFDEPTGPISDIDIAADGKTFCTIDRDGQLRYRSVSTGEVLTTLDTGGMPWRCEMSSDGGRVVVIGATSPDTSATLWVGSWSLPTGRPLERFTLDSTSSAAAIVEDWPFTRPSIDADRGRLYVSQAKRHDPGQAEDGIALVEIGSRGVTASRKFPFWKACLQIGPRGQTLALFSMSRDRTSELQILDATTLELRGRLTGYHDTPNDLAFSPDGSRLAAVMMDGRLQAWDASDARTDAPGPVLFSIDTAQDDPHGVLFNEDGSRIFTADVNRTIRVWDAATGAPLSQLPSQEEPVFEIEVVPGTDEIASTTDSGKIRFWTDDAQSQAVLRGHHSFVYVAEINPELVLVLTGGWDGFVGQRGNYRLWDLESGDPVAVWGEPDEWTYNALFLPDRDALLTVNTNIKGLARLDWIDLATGMRRDYAETGLTITSVQASTQRDVVWIQARGGTNYLLDIETAALIEHSSFRPPDVGNPSLGYRIAVTEDDQIMAVAARDHHFVLCRAEDGAVLHELPMHGENVASLAFDRAGRRLLSASEDGTVGVWDVATGQKLAELAGHDGGVLCARFDPSGDRIATGGRDGTLRIWDGTTYEPLLSLTGHTRYIYAVTWQDDGSRILTASGDQTVRIWETTPIRRRTEAHRERQTMVEALTPRVDAWLVADAEDSGGPGLLENLEDLSPREQQVARQILLGRRLGTEQP